jgi:mono/diheme cytochrome c family protein
LSKRTALSIALALTVCAFPALPGRAQDDAPDGDAARGRMLFMTGYRCYACHGFDAQTGERRLVPMTLSEQAFITFVQNSPLPQMPRFADVADQDLADIYAFVRTIPADAPPIEELPLLEGIIDRALAPLDE